VSLRPIRAAIDAWRPYARTRSDPLAAVIAAWPSVVGRSIAEHTRPVQLSGQTLLVTTRSGAWSQQLSLLSTGVLEGLHRLPEARHIRSLRFRVGTVRSPSATPPSVPRVIATADRRFADEEAPLSEEASAFEALDRFRAHVAVRRRRTPSCSACGAPGTGDGPCAPCAATPSAQRMAIAQRLMYDAPWLGFSGMAALIDGLERAEYERWRQHLLARWWEILRRCRFTKRVTTLERRIVSSYVLLQSGLDPDRVSPAVVRNLLGDELAALLDRSAENIRHRGESY
jgi:hypothetical protein